MTNGEIESSRPMSAACRARTTPSRSFCTRNEGEPYDPAEFDRVCKRAVADIVEQQVEIGIDVVSDGETSKIGYSTYVKDRYTGFGGEYQAKPHLDVADFPEFRKRMAAFWAADVSARCCIGADQRRRHHAPLKADIDNFKRRARPASNSPVLS